MRIENFPLNKTFATKFTIKIILAFVLLHVSLKQAPNCESFGAAWLSADVSGSLEVLEFQVLLQVTLVGENFVANFTLNFSFWNWHFWFWFSRGFEVLEAIADLWNGNNFFEKFI